MPIYEFKCVECVEDKEVMQSHKAPAPACDKCKKTMTKKISRSSFILAGGGWFKDGYSKGG